MNTRPTEERVVDFTGRQLGPYRLRLRVGDGGYSTVYRAEHQRDGSIVAVKVLDPRADRTTIDRFRREIELTRVLFEQDGNRHVIHVFDSGEDDGLRWYAMEFLNGHNLRTVLQTVKNDGLRWEVAAFIVQNVCYALAKMHDREVIHRDLKPDNIILERTATGQIWVKVIDLGIAKEISIESKIGEGKYHTSRNEIPGTGPYIAPERFSQALCTPATDQYSLGVVLYECLHGRLPFPETDNISTIAVQAHGSRDGIFWKPVPREIRDIVLRAIKPDSRQRFPSVLAMGQALHHCLRNAAEYVDGQATTLRLLDQLGQRRPEPQPARLVASRGVGDDDVTVKFVADRLAAELAKQEAERVESERLAAQRTAAAARRIADEAEAAEQALAARSAAAARASAEKKTTLEAKLQQPFLVRPGARTFTFLKRSLSLAMIAIAGMTECAADSRWRSTQEWLTRSPEPLPLPDLEVEAPNTPAPAAAPAKPARHATKPASPAAVTQARAPDKAPPQPPPEDSVPPPPSRAPEPTAKPSSPAAPPTPSPAAATPIASVGKSAEPAANKAAKSQAKKDPYRYAKQVVREECELDASGPHPSVELCLELALDSRGVPTQEFRPRSTTPPVELSKQTRECVLRIAHHQIKVTEVSPIPPSLSLCFKLQRKQ